MKKLLAILLFLVIVLSVTAEPKPELKIGYWIVTYTIENGYEITKTTEIADVYDLAEQQFPDNCIDFNEKLKTTAYVEITQVRNSFYVEVKKVTSKGKFRKLTNNEIKEYLK